MDISTATLDSKRSSANRAPAPEISVVIPSYNPGKDIYHCLDSVTRQEISIPYEIIVVDSSESDLSAQWQKEYPEVTFMHLSSRTFPGTARSIGVEKARGRIITFTDTDCVADSEWLKNIWEAHQQGYQVVGGSVGNGTPGSFVGTAEYLLEFNEVNPHRKAREVEVLPSCNLSIDRRIFDRYGLLENPEKGSDTLFCYKVVSHGIKIFFTPEARILHRNRRTLRKYLLNQQALGRGSAGIRSKTKRHGSFLVKFPFLIPFVPLFRTGAISFRLLRSQLRLFGSFLWHYPLILLGLCAYTLGFLQGLRGLSPATSELPDIGLQRGQ